MSIVLHWWLDRADKDSIITVEWNFRRGEKLLDRIRKRKVYFVEIKVEYESPPFRNYCTDSMYVGGDKIFFLEPLYSRYGIILEKISLHRHSRYDQIVEAEYCFPRGKDEIFDKVTQKFEEALKEVQEDRKVFIHPLAVGAKSRKFSEYGELLGMYRTYEFIVPFCYAGANSLWALENRLYHLVKQEMEGKDK